MNRLPPANGDRRRRAPFRPLIRAAAVWAVFLAAVCFAGEKTGADPRWQQLAGRIGPRDAVALAAPDGRRLVSLHTETPLIPASTLKLLTVLAGFDILGADHRFPTDFWVDPAGNLKIQGYGDPMLISEVVARIARQLAEALGPVARVGDLVLDESFFAEPLSIPGVSDSFEPYDAPNGALCVNFNTVYFRRTSNGRFESAEPQTPLLPVVVKRARTSGLDYGRIVLSRSGSEALFYAGHLFAHFLAEAGVDITGSIRAGSVDPSTDRLLFRHHSPFTLADVAGRLMEYSNNFIANQVLIAAGARQFGAPGTLEKGIRATGAFAQEKLGLKGLTIAEGSGISRKNRMTAEAMMTVLAHFFPHRHLLESHGAVRYKTGTLSGIRTRAGYIDTEAGVYRFVVLVNTPGRAAEPIVRMLVEGIGAEEDR